jgi:hypothetical protein
MKFIQMLHNGKLKQIRNRFGGNSDSWHAEAMFCRLRRRRAIEQVVSGELRREDQDVNLVGGLEELDGRCLIERNDKYEVFAIYNNGRLVSGHVEPIGDDERSARRRRARRRRR